MSMDALPARIWDQEPQPVGEAIALHDLTVVVPARNAEHLLDECLGGIRRERLAEYIVVDGQSADVVLHDGALASLLDEFKSGGFTALQAGLHSVGGPGYWGRALAWHHRTGRSRNWFGVVATIFERQTLLDHGFDARFLSGEDIDLRWRLRRAGAKIGVSRRTVVEHRFDDTFAFALGQWLADGRGLARMVDGHGRRGKLLLGLPLAAGVRGGLMALLRLQPLWLPYFAAFTLFNYVAIGGELVARRRARRA